MQARDVDRRFDAPHSERVTARRRDPRIPEPRPEPIAPLAPRTERVTIRPGLELAVERFDGGGEPLVLIMGFSAQMLLWPDGWCARLADAGFCVIRFDHRDIGLSTRLDHLPTPSPWDLLRAARGTGSGPYTLDDLAMDTVLLLDALGIDRAHIVGTSMGGMIAQLIAIHDPERVATLTSMMSTPSLRACGFPNLRVLASLLTVGADTSDEVAIDRFVRRYRLLESPSMRADRDQLEELGRRCLERGRSGHAPLRQAAAILGAYDRRPQLAGFEGPACVIHGGLDPLVHPRGGRSTAEALPRAEWVLVEAMAHDLPAALWDALVGVIVRTAGRGRVGG